MALNLIYMHLGKKVNKLPTGQHGISPLCPPPFCPLSFCPLAIGPLSIGHLVPLSYCP